MLLAGAFFCTNDVNREYSIGTTMEGNLRVNKIFIPKSVRRRPGKSCAKTRSKIKINRRGAFVFPRGLLGLKIECEKLFCLFVSRAAFRKCLFALKINHFLLRILKGEILAGYTLAQHMFTNTLLMHLRSRFFLLWVIKPSASWEH